MRFTLKNLRFLQYIDYQNVRKTEFLGCQSQEITHTAGRSNMKYAVGRLNAGGETFEVTIFVSYKQVTYKIQQLKILREK